jgi:hypothetical protein
MKNFSSGYYFVLAIMVAVVIIATGTTIAPIFAVAKTENDQLSEYDKLIDGAAIETTEETQDQVKKVTFKAPEPKSVKETVIETDLAEPAAEETDEVTADDKSEEITVSEEVETEIIETTETSVTEEPVEDVINETSYEDTTTASPVEVVVVENIESKERVEEPIYETGEPPIAAPEEITLAPPIVAYPLIKGDDDISEIGFDMDCDYFDGETYWHYDANEETFTEITDEVDEFAYSYVLF